MSFDYVGYNAEIVHKTDCVFPFNDAGFLYGYGLFETLRIHKGKIMLYREHLKRLMDTAIILDIACHYSMEELLDLGEALVKKNKVDDGVLNLYLTPGERDFSQSRMGFQNGLMLMVVRPFDTTRAHRRLHVGLREESFRRIKLDRFKSLNYMKNIMEKKLSYPFDDVILYDENRVVLESPTSNVCFVREKDLIVPDSDCILAGIVRQYLMDHVDDFGLKLVVRSVNVDDLERFEEVFLVNSIHGVMEVERLDQCPVLCSGPVTSFIKKRLCQLMGMSLPVLTS